MTPAERFTAGALHGVLYGRKVRAVDNGSGGILFLDTNELEARHRPRYLVYLVPANGPRFADEEVPVLTVPIPLATLARDVDHALDVLATGVREFEALLAGEEGPTPTRKFSKEGP